jgi:nuclear GTP-binding protein
MPKKSRKSLSKRVKLKDKFKIARKVKEHHKKQRKEAKKLEKKKPSVLKDPGIPANYPYREQVIKELQFEHQRIVAQRAEKRKAASERRQVCRLSLAQNGFAVATTLSAVAAFPGSHMLPHTG